MNPVLPDEALEFGTAAAKAFADLGGVDAAREAEELPDLRSTKIAPTLAALGLDDLDPRADENTLAAAAALCEAAGRIALPYPLPAALLRSEDGLPFAVVPDGRCRVDHGDLFGQWRVATLDGRASVATGADQRLGTRLGPFVADLVADLTVTGDGGEAAAEDAAADVALHLTLTAWQILGTADRAVELAVEHVSDRIQFGKPLSAFQAVQFQLADAAVAVAGLRELAMFTIWRLSVAPGDATADALALRVHALDVARTVLRTAQQLHGASGVCDEYDISVLTRHVQPALRLPSSAERTAQELASAIQRDGFDGLFEHGLFEHGRPA
ncbi:MAG: acyl-CoA dehydrogenase family protein [Acidimicrobiales bacterium]